MYPSMIKSLVRNKIWILPGLLLLLGGCVQQKLAYHETGFGMIAVPYQMFNETTYQMVRAIELKSSANGDFSVRLEAPPFNDDVILSEPIPQGEYLVDFYTTVVVPVPGVNDLMRQQETRFAEPVRVDLQDGDLFIFPVIFKAHQYNKVDYIFSTIDHTQLESSQQTYYRDKLSAMENSGMWTVKTPE